MMSASAAQAPRYSPAKLQDALDSSAGRSHCAPSASRSTIDVVSARRSSSPRSSPRRWLLIVTTATSPPPATSPTSSSHHWNSAISPQQRTLLPGTHAAHTLAPDDRLHPDPVAFTIGSFPVTGTAFSTRVGLAAVYLVLVHEAKRRGENPEIVGNALIIVAIAALIGGRLYHVIDQWAIYAADPIRVDPAAVQRPRRPRRDHHRHDRRHRPDAAGTSCRSGPGRTSSRRRVRHAGDRPARQLLQPGAVRAADDAAVGHRDRLRPPRRGVSVQRVPARDDPLPPAVPVRVAVRAHRLPRADLAGSPSAPWLVPATCSDLLHLVRDVRFVLEFFRSDNWTFFGIPTAQIVALGFILFGIAIIVYRHGPGGPPRQTRTGSRSGRRRRRPTTMTTAGRRLPTTGADPTPTPRPEGRPRRRHRPTRRATAGARLA